MKGRCNGVGTKGMVRGNLHVGHTTYRMRRIYVSGTNNGFWPLSREWRLCMAGQQTIPPALNLTTL